MVSLNKEFNILLFSLNLLVKRKRSFFIFSILTLPIFLVASASFIVESIKKELILTHEELPDIVVQRVVGGRQQYINMESVDKIVNIPGIKNIYPRIWGYYYFEYSSVNFSVVGIDPLEPFYKGTLEANLKGVDIGKMIQNDDWMILGHGVYKLFKEIGYVDAAYFKMPDGDYLKLKPVAILDAKSDIFTGDIVLISKVAARKVLGMEDDEVTDIAINVFNKNEIVTIAAKIRDQLKGVRTITKNDVLNSYKNVFNYKSGFFLILFGIMIFTMILLVMDKLSGLSETEKLEIGVLKVAGWTTGDILKLKFYEATFLAIESYIAGIFLALIYVYLLKAPIMIDLFSGYGSLKIEYRLIFALNLKVLFFVFFAVVPFYIAAVIIPSYRIATMDPYEVFR